MTVLGLPIVTALFVFMGPALALILSVVFARTFEANTEEWGLVDGRAKRRENPERGPGRRNEQVSGVE